jgi:hypothetical protein
MYEVYPISIAIVLWRIIFVFFTLMLTIDRHNVFTPTIWPLPVSAKAAPLSRDEPIRADQLRPSASGSWRQEMLGTCPWFMKLYLENLTITNPCSSGLKCIAFCQELESYRSHYMDYTPHHDFLISVSPLLVSSPLKLLGIPRFILIRDLILSWLQFYVGPSYVWIST